MPEPPTAPPPAPVSPVTPPLPPALSQADVDRAVAVATEAARRDAYTSALATLGTTDLDSAAAAVKAHNDAVAANQSDLEKAQQAQRDAEVRATQAETQRNIAALDALVQSALLRAGVPVDSLAKVARMVTVTDGSDLANVTAAVEALKAEVPAVFAPPAAPPAEGTPSWGGTAKPPTGQASVTALEKGAERYRRLHPSKAS